MLILMIIYHVSKIVYQTKEMDGIIFSSVSDTA